MWQDTDLSSWIFIKAGDFIFSRLNWTFLPAGHIWLKYQNVLYLTVKSGFFCVLWRIVHVSRPTVGECEASAMLPLECQYLNKSALNTLVGPLTPPVKHFQLKRKPKSATLRAELLQKCKLHHYLEASGTFLSFVVCLFITIVCDLYIWVCLFTPSWLKRWPGFPLDRNVQVKMQQAAVVCF